MSQAKVPPSVGLFKEFDVRMATGGLDLSSVVKLGAQYLLQCAVELEVKDVLGREYYRHCKRSVNPVR